MFSNFFSSKFSFNFLGNVIWAMEVVVFNLIFFDIEEFKRTLILSRKMRNKWYLKGPRRYLFCLRLFHMSGGVSWFFAKFSSSNLKF